MVVVFLWLLALEEAGITRYGNTSSLFKNHLHLILKLMVKMQNIL